MAADHHASIPIWTWVAPGLAVILLGLKFAHLVPGEAAVTLIFAALFLGGAVFAAVHHAEVLAVRLGEPFGSILLAVAVTVIEVALIVSILLSAAPGSEAVARDTVFAAAMIVLNGIVGFCLVLGGRRHHEQAFQLQAASAALAVLGTLAVLALVLPNYTLAVAGPYYSPIQLVFVGVMSFVLYASFVFVQTVRHREYFLDLVPEQAGAAPPKPALMPSNAVTAAALVLLIVSLTAVILLAKVLSAPLDRAVEAAGLPQAFVGVVIAAIVLLPEGLASVRAAVRNRLQSSMNLALGSAIASIGLTIPAVAVVSLLADQRLVLGLSHENTVLLLLTLFVSTLTLGTGRTTVLQGIIHLAIFAVFLLVAAVP